MRALRFACLVALLMLCGCAALQPTGAAPLPAGGWWKPLSPALVAGDFDALLRIDADLDGRRLAWLLYLEKRGDTLALVATSADGSALFQLTQQGTAVTITPSPLLPAMWRPEVTLMELQLALWPAAAIAANLPSSLRLQATSTGFELHRESAAAPLVAVERANDEPWRQPFALRQMRWHYHYRATPLDVAEP